MKNEVEVMEGRGFSRFYDCGNKVKSFMPELVALLIMANST